MRSSRSEPNRPPVLRIILFPHYYFPWTVVQDVGFQSTVMIQYADYLAKALFLRSSFQSDGIYLIAKADLKAIDMRHTVMGRAVPGTSW